MGKTTENSMQCNGPPQIPAEPSAQGKDALASRITPAGEEENVAIAHIDCDAFYASVEKRDNPSLTDRPVIVGGGRRGVVTTACYIARTYGVRSAMPMFKALALCPDAVVIKPDIARYRIESLKVRERLHALSPLVEPVSIDEAYIDLRGTKRVHALPPAEVLARFQQAISDDLGLSVSVGLSYNKFLAKIASDLEKPRGFTIIAPAHALATLARLEVRALPGVGEMAAQRLGAQGILRVGDIQRMSAGELQRRYGAFGVQIFRLAHGLDQRPVTPTREAKSISSETTFDCDLRAISDLERELWPLCESVSRRAKAHGLAGRVVTVRVKTAQFKTLSRRATLAEPSNLAQVLFRNARALLGEIATGAAIRLVGVGYSDLSAGAGQFNLLDGDERIARQEKAVDDIRARFGDNAVCAGRNFVARRR